MDMIFLIRVYMYQKIEMFLLIDVKYSVPHHQDYNDYY